MLRPAAANDTVTRQRGSPGPVRTHAPRRPSPRPARVAALVAPFHRSAQSSVSTTGAGAGSVTAGKPATASTIVPTGVGPVSSGRGPSVEAAGASAATVSLRSVASGTGSGAARSPPHAATSAASTIPTLHVTIRTPF